MQNHYQTLGLTNAASSAEIRRAYRILARRYHPDVNPNGNSEAVFKEIANAYSVLSEPEKKKQYDLELTQSVEAFQETFERAQEALKRNQQNKAYDKQRRTHRSSPGQAAKSTDHLSKNRRAKTGNSKQVESQVASIAIKKLASLKRATFDKVKGLLPKGSFDLGRKSRSPNDANVGQLALIELSISMHDAIYGVKKTVELTEGTALSRKVSVSIPPGVRNGSVVRLRNKENESEEVVLIIKIETHPWLSMGERGITIEIPLTIAEAIEGAKVQVPAFADPLLVTVEPGTQSGKEVRLKGQGITNRDGSRGDLYLRFIVKIPSAPLPKEIQSLSELLAESYSENIRSHLPKRI
ncbi:MAG: DnaJ C-terminal domain-containing protein [Pseudomonadota bacterium]|jgi:DnaJ-class molecular chaperone